MTNSLDDILTIAAGQISVIRLYDVGHEIDLARLERESSLATGATRIRLVRAKPKAVSFAEPPVEFGLGRTHLEIDGSAEGVPVEISVRVHGFGAISLTMTARIGDVPWRDFVAQVNRMDDAVATLDVWQPFLDRVRSMAEPAISKPSPSGLVEDYLLATVHRFNRPVTGEELLGGVDLVPLLAGETQPLSESARRDLLRHAYTYYRDDLVVISYARALIVEPGGEPDVADVLEVANAQLLELRYYDDRLDAELPRMYERVEEARQTFGGLARRRNANLARSLHTLVAEVTEVAERIDNALVVTEDVYLARVYAAALEQFRVRAWSGAVDRKLAIIRETYTALYDEAATARAEYLEIAIVLLIVFEIILAFLF